MPVLRFFGISLLADRNYHKLRREYLQKIEEDKVTETMKDQTVFGARLDEIDRGLFAANNEGDSEQPSAEKTTAADSYPGRC